MAEQKERFQIYPVWPGLIRRACARCGKGFRWEWGWRAYAGKRVWGYLCHDCAPDLRTARNYFFLLKAIFRVWRKSSGIKTHG